MGHALDWFSPGNHSPGPFLLSLKCSVELPTMSAQFRPVLSAGQALAGPAGAGFFQLLGGTAGAPRLASFLMCTQNAWPSTQSAGEHGSCSVMDTNEMGRLGQTCGQGLPTTKVWGRKCPPGWQSLTSSLGFSLWTVLLIQRLSALAESPGNFFTPLALMVWGRKCSFGSEA